MRKIIFMAFAAALAFGCYNSPDWPRNAKPDTEKHETSTCPPRVLTYEDSLIALANAYARQESNYRHDAVSPCGRWVGCLQISKIMVAEANRIVGFECYYDDDRYDRQGSYGIFKIVQEYHNPTLDIEKSVKVWNEKAPKTYRNNIKCYFDENLYALRNNELKDYFENSEK